MLSLRPAVALVLLAGLACGCSMRRLALRGFADQLATSGPAFASDGDPELVRDASPFALKTIEALLVELPEHRGLLLAACQGFAQYAYAFVETDAHLLGSSELARAEELQARALGLYLRARDYGLRALELRHPGFAAGLLVEPQRAASAAVLDEVPLLYWTGVAWGSAIGLARDRPELVADVPAVLALMRRALELDEAHDAGAIHEALIVLEALPANMGGSVEQARRHFERALELSGGARASTFAVLAESVALPAQDRGEFERLLGQALAVDPAARADSRLRNLIVQRRARHLLARAEELFLEP
jgi:hypothetical protein